MTVGKREHHSLSVALPRCGDPMLGSVEKSLPCSSPASKALKEIHDVLPKSALLSNAIAFDRSREPAAGGEIWKSRFPHHAELKFCANSTGIASSGFMGSSWKRALSHELVNWVFPLESCAVPSVIAAFPHGK